jgi:ankyrin repeat protein
MYRSLTKRLAQCLTGAALMAVAGWPQAGEDPAGELASAIRSGDLDRIERLLDGGVSPELRIGPDKALTWAAGLGAIDAMTLLRARGAGPDADAALAAATEGRTAALALLLDWGIDPDTADPYRMTLLSTAALHGHAETLGLLLDRGADWAIPELVYGYTPLILAAAHGHPEVVRRLIEHGADPDARTDDRWSALAWAQARRSLGGGYPETIALLQAAGAH